MNTDEKVDSATLGLLEEIEKNQDVTQRHLASHLGVALGLANSYLKRCARKGFIKIQQAPANRYLYYLTPKGFSEKSRLSAKYLSISFDFYRRASASIKDAYNDCETKDLRQILFCGASELAEIASLRAQEHDIHIIGTYDPKTTRNQFLHLPVWYSLIDVKPYDACLLTSLIEQERIFEELKGHIDENRIIVPSILGLDTRHDSRN
jgi:DNA-binding MarR family transcriptional regulator